MSGLLLFFIVLYAAILTLPVIYAWDNRHALMRFCARVSKRRVQ
jgi:hypothetical protein